MQREIRQELEQSVASELMGFHTLSLLKMMLTGLTTEKAEAKTKANERGDEVHAEARELSEKIVKMVLATQEAGKVMGDADV